MSGRSEIVSYSVAWCTETILEASQHEAWSCTLLKMGRFAEALWSSPNTKKHTPDEEARDTLAKTIRNQAEDGPSTRRAAVSSKKNLHAVVRQHGPQLCGYMRPPAFFTGSKAAICTFSRGSCSSLTIGNSTVLFVWVCFLVFVAVFGLWWLRDRLDYVQVLYQIA